MIVLRSKTFADQGGQQAPPQQQGGQQLEVEQLRLQGKQIASQTANNKIAAQKEHDEQRGLLFAKRQKERQDDRLAKSILQLRRFEKTNANKILVKQPSPKTVKPVPMKNKLVRR